MLHSHISYQRTFLPFFLTFSLQLLNKLCIMGREAASSSGKEASSKSPSQLTSPTLVPSGADETDSENERDENMEEQEEGEMAKEEEEEDKEEENSPKSK